MIHSNTIRIASVSSCIILCVGCSWLHGTQASDYEGGLPEGLPVSQPVAPAVLSPAIPADVAPILEQDNANEFSWQSFVALNWPALQGSPGEANTKAKFGEKGPVVWETYKQVEDVFLPDGKRPAPWGRDDTPQRAMLRVAKADSKRKLRVLNAVKADTPRELKGGIMEAGFSVASWLVSQNKKLTRFEVYINKTVFDYVYENEFYDARKQVEAVTTVNGKGVASPTGAMELKAAWMEISEGMDASRYHTTEALVPVNASDPSGATYKAKFGLVGLHFIHKTPNAPQYVWSTFEHVDNCPDVGHGHGEGRWNYFSNTLNPDQFNLPPQQNPNQVMRITPLPDKVVALNEKYQQAIRDYNRDNGLTSPWANYQLVNTQWPSNSVTIPPKTKTPLPMGNAIPRILTNTTMETYLQKLSCLSCHVHGQVASVPGMTAGDGFASDYSFVYGMAQPSK